MGIAHDKWTERYGEAVADALHDWFEQNAYGKHDNVDAVRAAKVGVYAEQVEYDAIQDGGCCGSVDVEIEIDGVTYAVGFNYGH